jgi:hypothetical protein
MSLMSLMKTKEAFGYAIVCTVAAFLFVFSLTGCDGSMVDDTEPYTFMFKVQNNSARTITKVVFLNGTNRNALTLRHISALSLGTGELSDTYKVSGFTGECGTDERYYAVIVTYADETDLFRYGHSSPESKILITSKDVRFFGGVGGNTEIEFSQGEW